MGFLAPSAANCLGDVDLGWEHFMDDFMRIDEPGVRDSVKPPGVDQDGFQLLDRAT